MSSDLSVAILSNGDPHDIGAVRSYVVLRAWPLRASEVVLTREDGGAFSATIPARRVAGHIFRTAAARARPGMW